MEQTSGAGTDAELVARVAGRDRAAFRTLDGRYRGPVEGFALRIVDRADRAGEVANDTLMSVWDGAERFEGRSKVSTWIFGIAYRIAHKTLRRKGVDRGRVAIDEAADLPDPQMPNPEIALQRKQVTEALHALPMELRAVMELTYYYGYSVAEVAEVIGCPPGTVKSRMHGARQTLKEMLS